MTIEVSYSDDGFSVEVKASGTVYGHEIIDAHTLFYPPAMLPKLKYVLFDKMGINEYYVSADEVQLIAELDKVVLAANPTMYLVMIVPENVLEIMSHVWKNFLNTSTDRVKIFHSRAEAIPFLRDIHAVE